jgi:hypothetical protein
LGFPPRYPPQPGRGNHVSRKNRAGNRCSGAPAGRRPFITTGGTGEPVPTIISFSAISGSPSLPSWGILSSEYLPDPGIRTLNGPGLPFPGSWLRNYVQKCPVFVHGFPGTDDLPRFTAIGAFFAAFFVQ